MKQTQRHDAIIELVKLQGYVSTEELVEHFSVSPQTIRRDLNDLADQKKILRHHGGAALPSSSVNTPWHDRKATQTAEKERIAHKVASQIPNGSALFIDIGTTPEAVAHALLNHSDLRIVTNNLNVANTLMVKDDFRIILAGGEPRSRDGGIIGEATLDFISQFRLDYGILGISGIDSDGSLLEFDYHEVRTKRAIIDNSRHVILVVDHSKFGRNAMVNMGSISMVDAVYTDVLPPPGVMQVIAENEVQLELCKNKGRLLSALFVAPPEEAMMALGHLLLEFPFAEIGDDSVHAVFSQAIVADRDSGNQVEDIRQYRKQD